MATERMKLGLEAEEAVCKHLMGQGYAILDRNWSKPWGELDIVAAYRGVVHVIEVKASSRRISGFDPFLRADERKMHKVKRTAITWLSWNRYGPDTEWQMDIASVIMGENGPEIELFENI